MLDEQIKETWRKYSDGEIDEATAEAIVEALQARRAGKRTKKPRPPRITPRSPGPARPPAKREKMFGDGRAVPLDRNAKARITTLAKALMRPTEKGKHWGPITAKFFEVLKALLWAFHNAKRGRCFPSYKTIAEKADCTPDTVGRAIVALEQVGLLSWCNRLARVSIRGVVRVIRTSNAYWFNDPAASRSKSEFKSGTRFTVYQERKQDGASRAEVVSRKRGGDIQAELPSEEVT